MTTPQERPQGYGIIDDNDAGQPAGPVREIPESFNGFQVNQVPPRTKWNHPQQRHGRWVRWFDQQTPIHPQFFGLQSTRLSLDTLVFSTDPGLEQTSEENALYVVNGYIVDLSRDELEGWGLSPYTFEALKDTHVYTQRGTDLNTPPLRFEAVALATPPAPGVNELYLGTMTTDATDATLWTIATNDANDTRRVRVDRVWHFEQAVEHHRTVNWIAENGNLRTHKRQNKSASAKGFTYSDTRTFESVTGANQHLTVLTASLIPADAAVAVEARVSGVNVADATSYGFAARIGYYRNPGGSLDQVGAAIIDSSALNDLSAVAMDRSGDDVTCKVTVGGGITMHIEVSFTATIAFI